MHGLMHAAAAPDRTTAHTEGEGQSDVVVQPCVQRPPGSFAQVAMPPLQSEFMTQAPPMKLGGLMGEPRSQQIFPGPLGSATHSLVEWQSASVVHPRLQVKPQALVPAGHLVDSGARHMPDWPRLAQVVPAPHSAVDLHARP